MSTLSPNHEPPHFPPTTTCTTCGHLLESLPSLPPPLPTGNRFAAAFAKYIAARTEFYEASRRAGESMCRKLEGAAPAAGSVG
jgi:hypothetical protein